MHAYMCLVYLEMQREKNILVLRVSNLLFIEGNERLLAHHGSVDHLTCGQRGCWHGSYDSCWE
jgi:hypothetical protein